MSYSQLTFQLPQQRLERSAVKVTPILTVPDHHIAPSVAALAARGCARLTPRGGGSGEEKSRRRQVTNGGVSEREAGWGRVWHEVTPRWLLTPCDGFQLLLLRPFHVYDICTPWHLWLAVWLPRDISLRTLVACQTHPHPLRHSTAPSHPHSSQMHLALSAVNSHSPAKESNRERNYCLRIYVKCNFTTFFFFFYT